MRAWLDEKGVIPKGGGLDEAPQAYRRLPDVLAAQGDTMDAWARKVASWIQTGPGHDVYVYFDNDAKVHAPFDAIGLRTRVDSLLRHKASLL